MRITQSFYPLIIYDQTKYPDFEKNNYPQNYPKIPILSIIMTKLKNPDF